MRSGHLTGFIERIKKSNLFGAISIALALLVTMLILKPGYLSSTNCIAIIKVLSVTALVGFSQMIVIASGGMNVSVGATGALCAVITGGVMDQWGISAIVALVIGLLTGVICGVINGLLIYRAGGVGTAFFLTTLATSSVFQGINLMITSGNPFYGIDPAFFALGDTEIFGIPLSFYLVLVIAFVIAFVFRKLKIGRQILAYGSNPKSAQLYGISKFKVVMLSNIMASIIAAIAGMVALIRIQAAQPNMGTDWMLISFAAPLIGGTRLAGGRVNVFGAIIGAIALTIISNGLVHLAVDVYWNTLIYGCVILLAVTVDRLRYIRA